MKLSVLTENTASGNFLAEFGLSYFIEHENRNILFDTGSTDVFLRNAEKLAIDLDHVDAVVLSHGHWDHGNGLRYVRNKKLVCHPDAFMKRYRKNSTENIGLELSYEELDQRFELTISREPYPLSKNMIFLGEIPRETPFEAQTTAFMDQNGEDDFVPDDSALAIVVDDELIVVSGCAHSGICNIVEYAKRVTGLKKIMAVIGGFHLKENDMQTRKTIHYFKAQKIRNLYPSHCTQLPALAAFYREFEMEQVKTGMVFTFSKT